MNLSITLKKIRALSDIKKAILLSFLLGASSIVCFKTPYMPVHWIIQNQICLMIGYVFGARVGLMSASLFLIEGALGAPFFSMGRSGLGMILGPSGGYLLAYPLAAALCGYLKKVMPKNAASTFVNLFVSNLAIYTLGVLQLAFFIGVKKAMWLGLIPFIALDAIKTVFATFILCARKV
jgi:biotin transport system substrate-specific component